MRVAPRTLHGTTNNATSSTSIVTQRDWAIAKGKEWKFSNTTLLEGSLKRSYGENFFESRRNDLHDDLYREKPQPVMTTRSLTITTPTRSGVSRLSDNTTEPARYITVIFPDVTQSNAPSAVAGAACDGWYSPGHQPYNVWSMIRSGLHAFQTMTLIAESLRRTTQEQKLISRSISTNFRV